MSLGIERWTETLRLLGIAPNATQLALGEDLLQRYCEPHRHYHSLAHLEDCLRQAANLRPQFAHAGEVEFALWVHDAIYDTRKTDNEQRCADWARQSVITAGLDAAVARRIHELILATRHAALPATADAALLVDIDLSILGADAARFDAYEHEIRSEYHWVPSFLFNLKRKQLLREFLARPKIYSSAEYQRRLEAPARANLARSIAR
ncbi:MAG: N-methyl-D-aspartate receptor NMDAR2C subunit [Xanthomonadales bacterium]|nr:N-methyl-D-aspartate receptor NMDAR2C subunit [Xanthomonadales bacterium]